MNNENFKVGIENKKEQLLAWKKNMNIPGKVQSFFTQEINAESVDWKIYNKLIAKHATLILDAPVKNLEPPKVVSLIYEQIKKQHLKNFKKALRTIWIRATGEGHFALIIQANLRGKNSAHESKIFVEFVKYNCPQIISCHQIQCEPFALFDPSIHQKVRIESRANFGKDFMPIANTGFYLHVLDWSPRVKDVWFQLPQRIIQAIHPQKEDKFFEFYSGSSFVSASLAPYFSQVEMQDPRECSMNSSLLNAKNVSQKNMRFHRGFFSTKFLIQFFSKAENEGKWTFYFNLPQDELWSKASVFEICSTRPERILIQLGDLEKAYKLIKQFRNFNYMLRKIIPLDMEPNTSKFEILLLFVPDRVGLLGVSHPKKAPKISKSSNKAVFAKNTLTFKQRKD